MAKSKVFIISITFPLLLLLTLGCGGDPRVTGRVTFADDGSPVTSGTVIFSKTGYTGRAAIDSNGRFSVHSEAKGHGIPPGTYRVHLEGTERATVEDGGFRVEHLIDRRYTNPETSGLSLTVEGSRTFDIVVERFSGN